MTDSQIYQDFTFHNLVQLDGFRLPIRPLASQPVLEEGSLFYNLTDNVPYVSNGSAWVAVLAATTDIAADISITAQDIALTADVDDITLTAADDIVSAASGSFTVTAGDAAATAISLTTTNVAGGVDINAGTGGIAADSTGAISLGAAAASDFTVTGAFDLTLASTAGSIVVNADESAADAIFLDASTGAAGGVTFATGTGGISFPKATVTQITNINTAVTIDSTSGVITTVSATTAGSDADAFTVNNNRVLATSVVHANVIDYAGDFNTNGLPVISVDAIGAGSFDIVIINADDATALSGVLQIAFTVV